jgi:two-component system, OmpR family, sensor kinase
MLDRLEGSFTSQRTFLDDAGHELRTPLTVLRTHLELLTPDDPREVEETRTLLLDEVDRMSRLVEDMTLLAKSNRPDFLRLDAVDVEQLTRTAFAKATALGPRDWLLDEVARGTAQLDQQRVTQAVLQLADNAVKHTDLDATIRVGSRVEAGILRIWVRDSGAGVPTQDRELIFERFGRSQVRGGDEGFGLGLSIVKAIAESHGGSAMVVDVIPHGAEFLLTLPLEVTWPIS